MAAASNSELSENIRDQFLQCKICLEGLKAPKTLPCLHTFCAECIAYYIQHNNIDNRKFACPICRRHIYIPKNGHDGFPDSFFVSNLSEMVDQQKQHKDGKDPGSSSQFYCGICRFKEGEVEAQMLCIECKMELCEECVTAHKAAKLTAQHTMVPVKQPGTVRQENYCRVHKGEVIKFYCETCNAPICLPCTFLDHKGHEIEEIKAVRESFSQDIEGMVMQSEDKILQLVATKDDMMDLENELFVRKESVKSQIQRSIQEIIRSINEQKSKLMTEIDEFYDTVTVAKDRQKLERTVYRLERAHDYAKQLLSSETSPITQIVNRNDAKENLKKALDYELPDVSLHAEKLDKYAYFMPGNVNLQLGSLLKCTGPGHSTTVNELRPVLPASLALYMHKLRMYDEPLGDVIALTLTNGGDVVVLTNSEKKVKVFNKTGRLKFEFGDDEELEHPSDLVITREGDIAITDCGDMSVKVFDPYGSLKHKFGEKHMSLPISIAVDTIGRLLVCDQAKQRVSIHRTTGELIQNVHIEEVPTPTQISCYGNKLYICDSDNKQIIVYYFTEEELHFVARLTAPESSPTGNGHFLDCSGIDTDRFGNLLIADMTMDKLHCFNSRGELSCIQARGKPILRPMCVSSNNEGLLAVAQHGVFPLEEDMPTTHEVLIFKLVKADV